MRKHIIIIGLMFLVSACSGSAVGTVFYDSNGNLLKDAGENGIPNLSYSITKDGANFGSGTTSSEKGDEGSFSFPIKDAGYYCVTVSPVPATITGSASSVTKGIAIGKVANVASGGTCSANTDCASGICNTSSLTCQASGTGTAGQGSPCTSDSDCTSGLTCTGTGGTCTGSTASATTTTPTTPNSTGSLKTCMNATGYGSHLTMDVPVVKQPSQTLQQIPDPAAISGTINTAMPMSIYYPCSCKPLSLILPAGISTSQPASADISSLDLSTLTSSTIDTDIASYNVTMDSICKVSTNLFASAAPTSGQVTLSPQAICPDGSTIALKPQTISFTSGATLNQTITCNGSDCSSPWSASVVLTTGFSGTQTEAGALMIVLPTSIIKASTTPAISGGQNCAISNGSDVVCNIEPGYTGNVVITFTFPDCTESIPGPICIPTTFTSGSSTIQPSSGLTCITIPTTPCSS